MFLQAEPTYDHLRHTLHVCIFAIGIYILRGYRFSFFFVLSFVFYEWICHTHKSVILNHISSCLSETWYLYPVWPRKHDRHHCHHCHHCHHYHHRHCVLTPTSGIQLLAPSIPPHIKSSPLPAIVTNTSRLILQQKVPHHHLRHL